MKINHILSPVTEPVTEFVAGMFCLELTVVDLDALRTVGVGELIIAQLSNIRISRIHKIYNISSYDIPYDMNNKQQHHVDYSAHRFLAFASALWPLVHLWHQTKA
jgi:hypothetical protein